MTFKFCGVLLEVTTTVSEMECIHRFYTGSRAIHDFLSHDKQIAEPIQSFADKFKSNSHDLCSKCNGTTLFLG